MSATPNLCDPPGAASYASPAPTRETLAELIRSFLASDITAFAFDEKLDPYRDSDDPVIYHVVNVVWYHYDDCDDHLVCFSKQQWDYFQRLLLVLSSNCRVETEFRRQWSFTFRDIYRPCNCIPHVRISQNQVPKTHWCANSTLTVHVSVLANSCLHHVANIFANPVDTPNAS
jgi:hypothetical protein